MRMPAHLRIGALLRRAAAEGGHAAVIARGDPDSGGLVIVCRDRGVATSVLEGATDLDGGYMLRPSGPAGESMDEAALDRWIAGRRARDRDLWLIDLDIASAERFAAETIEWN